MITIIAIIIIITTINDLWVLLFETFCKLNKMRLKMVTKHPACLTINIQVPQLFSRTLASF